MYTIKSLNQFKRIVLILLLIPAVVSCVNPFKRGAWSPLPLKVMHKEKVKTDFSKDSTMTP